MEAATQLFLGSDIYASNSAQVTFIHPEDIYRLGATNDPFHSDINSTFNNTTETPDVFLSYPRGLLYFAATCFVAFAVIGVLGNFISILALSRCNRLRNATTSFIVNLGVADLLFCSITMPLTAIQYLKGSRSLSEPLCKIFPILLYSNTFVSLFSVIAITVNRYILIVHRRIYPSVYIKRNTAIMIALTWLIPYLILILSLLDIWGTLGYDPKVLICTIVELDGKSPNEFLFILGFGLTFIIFPFCYIRIFFAVRKASKKVIKQSEMPNAYTSHGYRKELRVLRVMLVILILFFVCYIPAFIMNVFFEEPYPKYLNVLIFIGVYITNIMNPVIYIVMSKEYRTAYKELFCRRNMK